MKHSFFKHIFMCICLVAALNSYAYDAQIDGIYYVFYENKAIVTYQKYQSSYPNNYYSDYSGSVIIPSAVTYNDKTYNVTSIDDYAFYNCSGLTTITIPNSVTSIGSSAFEGCSVLTSINIPNSVTSIGSFAFSGCNRLTSVTIPNSVTSIGRSAFSGCSRLTSINIPGSVTSIGEATFNGCTGLTSINIPGSVTSIGNYTFSGCYCLTSITIPESVTNIGDGAFYSCSGLTSITIPNSVTSIGNYVFCGCNSLTAIKVEAWNSKYDSRDNCNAIIETATNTLVVGCQNSVIPNSVTSIDDYAFYSCSGLTSVTIPNSVTSIGWYAFDNCNSLTSVTIGSSVTSIDEYAFYGCSGLTSVHITDLSAWCRIKFYDNPLWYAHHLYLNGEEIKDLVIPDDVTNIGNYTFSGCTGLTSVTIPNSVTSIDMCAFEDCSSLTSVHITDLSAWCRIKFCAGENSNPLEYAHHLYLNGEEIKNLVIPNDVTSIGAEAFYGCSGLTSITIPNSVTSIYYNAFSGCSGLTSITIGSGVEYIGQQSFYKCSELKDVYCCASNIPNTNSNAFDGSHINKITLHVPKMSINSYKAKVPWSSFGNIVPIENITFADANVKALCVANWDPNQYGELSDAEAAAVTDLDAVFSGKYQIKSFDELQYFIGLSSIGDRAFFRCNSMQSVTIPEGVTSIGFYAFYDCSSLTSLTIPKNVRDISSDSFPYCNGLTSINVEEGNEKYDSRGNCNAVIETATNTLIAGCRNTAIPESVTSIGSSAFAGRGSLMQITIPEGVTSIGSWAFSECRGLTSISIPDNVTKIGEGAFNNCNGLTSASIGKGVTRIGERAFMHCSKLADVYCQAKNPPSAGNDLFESAGIETATLHVPKLSLEQYKAAAPWSSFGNIVPIVDDRPLIIFADATVKSICVTNWDTNWDGELNVDEAAAVTDIGEAFKGKGITSFNELQYFTGLTGIVSSAFEGCESLTSIIIPEKVAGIGLRAFSGCNSLASIKVDAGNTALDSRNDCNAIIETATNILAIGCKNTIIPNSVAIIKGQAFYNCTGLTSVTIPDNVNTIGYAAFYGCENLASITIGSGVIYIGEMAFSGCKLFNILTKCTTPPTISRNTFSEQTLYHIMLYVPTGSWSSYIYDNVWYLFHNIRETVTKEEQLSMQQAYMLMDAGTFAYSVYDPVNDRIGTVNSVSGIDENNPYHSWQVIEADGEQYLYNVGARKFVVSSSDGSYTLSDTPASIGMENGSNGIIIGSQKTRQWALVSNDRLSAEQAIITGVSPLGETEDGAVYDLQGRKIVNYCCPLNFDSSRTCAHEIKIGLSLA